MKIAWISAGGTDVGRVREANEDSYRMSAARGVFLVADGMGGHAAGEVASRLAASGALEKLSLSVDLEEPALPDAILSAFSEAHRRIVDCCEGDPRTEGMGTTLTLAILRRDGTLHIGHLGDSRLYRLRDAELDQLTTDHTWVQQEVDAGRLQPASASGHPLSHVLTRVLTADEPAEPDLIESQARPGDVYLLCSDGLHNMLEAGVIAEHLASSHDPSETVDRLLRAANRRGGVDNVTVIVISVSEAAEG